MIESSANLGIHGQGLLKLSGPGDSLRAQRLFLSLFYTVHVSDFSSQFEIAETLGLGDDSCFNFSLCGAFVKSKFVC